MTVIPEFGEAEAGESRVQGQPGQFSKTHLKKGGPEDGLSGRASLFEP